MVEGDIVYVCRYKHPKKRKLKNLQSSIEFGWPPYIVEGLTVYLLYGVSRFRLVKSCTTKSGFTLGNV